MPNEQVQSLVSNIISEDHLQAEQSFNQVIMEKVSTKLEEFKKTVMSNILEKNEPLEEATLTRKHMVAAAKEIASEPNLDIRKTLHAHHAKIFAASNPRFDAERFKKASGL